MKPFVLTLTIGLVLGGSVLAQDASVGARASGQSASSVSASGNNAGASASHASSASAATGSEHAAANVAESAEMNATLSKSIDARRTSPGDEVTATLAQDATGDAGTPLPRGTKLIGRVTEAQPHGARSSQASGSSDSRLGMTFFKAIRPDGSEVPVTATLQAVAAGAAAAAAGPDAGDGWGGSGAYTMGDARAAGSATGVGGLLGSAAGAGGATLGGVASAGAGGGAGIGRIVTSSAGSATDVSTAAVGGFSASGQLLSGSRGVFGIRGVELVPGAAGNAHGSVLTSETGNVHLGRGTQMLLVNSAAGTMQQR